jgi:hypothetical protein
MQLRTARLCLDCEEVHDAQRCPVCASETFTFITRWVPAPERRRRPRTTSSPEAEVYRRLVSGELSPSPARRILKQGVVGLTAIGLVGLFWPRKSNQTSSTLPGTMTPDTGDGGLDEARESGQE